MDKENQYLIQTKTIAGQRYGKPNILSFLILHVVGQLPREDQAQLLEAAKERGGLMDVRLVIEGHPFSILGFNERLEESWKSSLAQTVQRWIKNNSAAVELAMREALDTVVRDLRIDADDAIADLE